MKLTIEFGLCAEDLSKQLADFDLPKEKISEWQAIADFIVTAHFRKAATDNAVTKLNKLLGSIIAQEIRERSENGT